jgi:hypothetical protein
MVYPCGKDNHRVKEGVVDQSVSSTKLDGIWQGDTLDRRADAEFLQRFLVARINERAARGIPKSYVLNIDAKWGFGKSYFLQRLGLSLKEQGFLVASVDAWRDDHADDPLLSVMSAIDLAMQPIVSGKKKLTSTWKAVKQSGASVAVAVAKGAAKHWSKKLVGEGLEAALDALESAKNSETAKVAEENLDKEVASLIDKGANLLLQEFKEGQRTIEKFRSELKGFLQKLEVEGSPIPLFVLVDELDRCRPPYAISLLERVKHLFDIDNVVFIIATDSDQLRHAVGAVYGQDFDSKRYLFRFFDRTYTFDDPSPKQFIGALLNSSPINLEKVSLPPDSKLDDYLSGAFEFFGLSLRDIEQCFEILRGVITTWNLNLEAELVVLLPLIIGHQQGMPIELSPSFAKRMGEFANANRRGSTSWTVPFSEYVSGQGHVKRKVSGLDLFSKFIEKSSQFLNRDFQQSTGIDDWVNNRFSIEFMRLHGNIYRPGKEPISILRKYPSIVKTAGRLVPAAANEKA